MMKSKVLKDQFSKVQLADLSNYNEECISFVIPKLSHNEYKVGGYYLIEVDDNILSDEDSTLRINWNNNTVPPFKVLKINVLVRQQKMIKVQSFGFDLNTNEDIYTTWSGWLPVNQIKLLKEI